MKQCQSAFCADCTFIDNLSASRIAQRKVAIAVSEILHQIVAHLCCGSYQPAHINGCVFSNSHTGWINQQHLTVGSKLTINGRLTTSGNTVQRQRSFPRLDEIHAFALINVKLCPVHSQPGRILANSHVISLLGNGAIS